MNKKNYLNQYIITLLKLNFMIKLKIIKNFGIIYLVIGAINILEQNQDKINWNFLCLNENAIHILEKNIKKINWSQLLKNENAIYILE